MANQLPQTWHYGLVARWWAEFNTDGPEIEFFRAFVERGGGPALDAACGAGRLLIPYLDAGLDVDGCDISTDMLTLCRERALTRGLQPSLFQQALHELRLPRSYRTVLVCGSFGLGGSREQDQEALRRIHSHLDPGGCLCFDQTAPYADADDWRYWLEEERLRLPEPWPPRGRRKRAANGEELEIRTRTEAFDPLHQLITWQIQAELFREGVRVQQEEYTLRSILYFRNELVDMLRLAGFGEVQVSDGYTEAPARAESKTLTFVARA